MIFSNKSNNNVIALTIIRSDTLHNGKITDDSLLWICQRHNNPEKSHPNSVCIPTQRVPKSLFTDVLKHKSKNGNRFGYTELNGHHPVIYAIESIMSKKLGLAQVLNSKHIDFEASIKQDEFGQSACTHTNQSEYIRMLNILVQANAFKNQPLTFNPISYQKAEWVQVKLFKKVVEEQDPNIIGFDNANFADKAMCVKMAFNLLKNRNGES